MNESLPDKTSAATPRTDRAVRIWIVIHGLIVLGWSFASARDQGGPEASERVGWIMMSFAMSAYVAIPLMAIFNPLLFSITFERKNRFLEMLWILDALLISAQIQFLIPMIQ